MTTWMRFGWSLAALGGFGLGLTGSTGQAASIASSGLSASNQTTAMSSWSVHPTKIPTPTPPTPPKITPHVTPTPPAPLKPAVTPSPVPVPVHAPVITPAITVTPHVVPTSVANAFVNLGKGPYVDAAAITTGSAQPWYASQNQTLASFFGGSPTAQQQAAFTSAVMQRVEQTFQLSGVNVSLTTNPGAPAAHTLSLVSNTSAQILPGAIGMTYVGGSGFSFIDQQAPVAQTLDQLEWITAHNIAHELMLAFGVGEKYDATGNYVDARNALWSMMTNPNATFSASAAAALNQALAEPLNKMAETAQAQVVEAHPVPEPAALVLWALAAASGLALRRRPRNRASA